VLVALYEDGVRAAARALDPYRGTVTIDVEWGNVFMPASVARLDLSVVMGSDEHRALVLGDLYGDLTEQVLERSLLVQLLLRYKPDAVVDSINTATAFAYQDLFQSARQLHEQSKRGGADQAAVEQHLLRLTLPQLIRHAQIITEGLNRAGTKPYQIERAAPGRDSTSLHALRGKPSRTLLTKPAVAERARCRCSPRPHARCAVTVEIADRQSRGEVATVRYAAGKPIPSSIAKHPCAQGRL
jgi:hypothetical protein